MRSSWTVNACELLDQSKWCRKVAEPLTNVTEATVGAFNVPVLYQMDLITGDPDVAFFGGFVLFCTTWPVAAAHVCVPLAIGFVYEWWTQVSAVW